MDGGAELMHHDSTRDHGRSRAEADRPPLIGRRTEQQALDDVLDDARAGMGRALVVRGGAGVGKSSLLDDAIDSAADLRVLRVVAVEAEMTLGYSGIHQLLLPLLPDVDRLPEPQQRALEIAFGMRGGAPPDPFLIGLSVLTLLADAAESRPVLVVVDDAEWLDEESAQVLGFVARRLLADSVAMLFAVRDGGEGPPRLPGLPHLWVGGLARDDAGQLLEAAVGAPLDASVGAQIVRETGGNPLAVLEIARELTAAQLEGRSPLPQPLPLGRRLQELFRRRIRRLPPDTQALLLLAAADGPKAHGRLWQAAAELGIPESAAAAAEAAGLSVLWPDVEFRHPLVRSAVYHGATAAERRQAHQALAAVCDPDLDADGRTWHLAAATAGPDTAVAAEVDALAERAMNRGSYATAARLLRRAALLTADPARRAGRLLRGAGAELAAGAVDRARALLTEATPRLHDRPARGHAILLDGRIQLAEGRGAEAAATLLRGAQALQHLDAGAARDALLSALEAVLYAGWSTHDPLLQEIALTAEGFPETEGTEGTDHRPADLLMRAYATRVTRGYAAAVPAFRRAVAGFLAEDLDPDVGLQRLGLAILAAAELADPGAVEALAARWVHLARDVGALSTLALSLTFRAAFADAPSGRLAAASSGAAECRELAGATGSPRIAAAAGNGDFLALVLRGREAEARAAAAGIARGTTAAPIFAAYGLGILELGVGNYEAAARCFDQVCGADLPYIGTSALAELVEASVRSGRQESAETALRRYAERATAAGTPLALGVLARSSALLTRDADGARARYDEAIELLGRSGNLLELARAHLVYGEWLRRGRHRREARDQLRRASDMFDAMGLCGFAERARIELRATGERVGGREQGTPEPLTPQEAQIATLVSQGEANRAIAARLFISPSTVEYHLRKVFRKLGVTSRTQLARRVLDAGPDDPVVPSPRPADGSVPAAGKPDEAGERALTRRPVAVRRRDDVGGTGRGRVGAPPAAGLPTSVMRAAGPRS